LQEKGKLTLPKGENHKAKPEEGQTLRFGRAVDPPPKKEENTGVRKEINSRYHGKSRKFQYAPKGKEAKGFRRIDRTALAKKKKQLRRRRRLLRPHTGKKGRGKRVKNKLRMSLACPEKKSLRK